MHDVHDDHGQSVAAWTGVAVLLIAATLIAIGVFFGNNLVVVAGVVVGVVGLVVAIVLSKTGFGVEAKRRRAASATSEERTAVR